MYDPVPIKGRAYVRWVSVVEGRCTYSCRRAIMVGTGYKYICIQVEADSVRLGLNNYCAVIYGTVMPIARCRTKSVFARFTV